MLHLLSSQTALEDEKGLLAFAVERRLCGTNGSVEHVRRVEVESEVRPDWEPTVVTAAHKDTDSLGLLRLLHAEPGSEQRWREAGLRLNGGEREKQQPSTNRVGASSGHVDEGQWLSVDEKGEVTKWTRVARTLNACLACSSERGARRRLAYSAHGTAGRGHAERDREEDGVARK